MGTRTSNVRDNWRFGATPLRGDPVDQRVMLTWQVSESRGFETAWVDLGERSLAARGRAVGAVQDPYWLSYELETRDEYVTSRLLVTVETAAEIRRLDLHHDDTAGWTVNGAPRPDLADAADCDLGLSPLTNTMPVLRHRLHDDAGTHTFTVAWVSVPDLTVHRQTQSYTYLGVTGLGAVVRFESGDFRNDLVFDEHGLLLDYPGLASRFSPLAG
jgi:uncharacterized protein